MRCTDKQQQGERGRAAVSHCRPMGGAARLLADVDKALLPNTTSLTSESCSGGSYLQLSVERHSAVLAVLGHRREVERLGERGARRDGAALARLHLGHHAREVLVHHGHLAVLHDLRLDVLHLLAGRVVDLDLGVHLRRHGW